jgi:hypothetical protein
MHHPCEVSLQSDPKKYFLIVMVTMNVQRGTDNINMKKLSTQDNNPYDAESVMQYALYVSKTLI